MRLWRGKWLALALGSGVIGLVGFALLFFREEIRAFARLHETFDYVGRNDQGFLEFRHRETGIVMVLLPGGRFEMGRGEADGWSDEAPAHQVTLSPFLIAKYEVSGEQWERVIGPLGGRSAGPDSPVERVEWHHANRFCYETGLRLPTEAEWEYACKGRVPGSEADEVSSDANYLEGITATPGSTVPVDSGAPNRFGLYHMQGNVSEWCEDFYDFDFYSSPEASGVDPVCREGLGSRVVRGGNYASLESALRRTFRAGLDPDEGHPRVGFRPALSF